MIEGPEAVVVADMPLLEFESNPVGPDIATRFRRAVTHDKGGVFIVNGRPSLQRPLLEQRQALLRSHCGRICFAQLSGSWNRGRPRLLAPEVPAY